MSEESLFIAGMKRHGVGHWQQILDDSNFRALRLAGRTNVNLKDKHRNLLKKGRLPACLQ